MKRSRQRRGSGYVLVWDFFVRRSFESRFERAYGPAGAWAKLFARSKGYRGTELFRDERRRGRYVTVDTWSSRAAYDAFRRAHRRQYEKLDRRFAAWTVRETSLGSFLGIARTRRFGR